LYRFFIFLEEEEAGKHSRKPAGRQGPDRSRAERAEKDAE
jgi:hypothetical protein